MRHNHHPLVNGSDVGLSQVQRNKNTLKYVFLVENCAPNPCLNSVMPDFLSNEKSRREQAAIGPQVPAGRLKWSLKMR
jgi:hypothetical protein